MDTFDKLPRGGRLSWILTKYFPFLYQGLVKVMQRSLKGSPEKLLASFKPKLPPPDYAVLEAPGRMEIYRQSAIEALYQGTRGATWDVQLYLRQWDFSLNEIQMPITMLYGEQDKNVPLDLARQIAANLPQAQLMIFPNEGHISVAINQIDVIAKVLVGD